MSTTTITIQEEVKKELDVIKLHPREPYSEVIFRMIMEKKDNQGDWVGRLDFKPEKQIKLHKAFFKIMVLGMETANILAIITVLYATIETQTYTVAYIMLFVLVYTLWRLENTKIEKWGDWMKPGAKYLSGYINLGVMGDIKINVFPNDKRVKDSEPHYNITTNIEQKDGMNKLKRCGVLWKQEKKAVEVKQTEASDF